MFFGELGEESCNLVSYFEARGAKHLNRGENPVSVMNCIGECATVCSLTLLILQANWMLTVITSDKDGEDYVEDFLQSSQYEIMKTSIQKTI